MNGKTARMLRKMKADDTQSVRLWKTLNHTQRGKVRATFKSEGPEKALIKFMVQLGNIRD